MAEPRGAVAGTFLAGEMLAGELQYPFDPPELLLVPRIPNLLSPPYTSLTFRRPQLLLQGKATQGVSRTTLPYAMPFLVLTSRAMTGVIPPAPLLQRPALLLTARAFTMTIDQTLLTGMPFLILTGKRTFGRKPGMTPSVPVDVILTPTAPQESVLVASVPVDDSLEWLLRPTTEVPA